MTQDNTQMVELLPCPFCGASDAEVRKSLTDALVACNNCGSRTGLVYLGADDATNAAKVREAVAIWNTRHTPEPATELVEALRVASEIAERAPELNMANYDEDQVAALNADMIELCLHLRQALSTPSQDHTS
jgi:Lar family restriction alleviation protein